MIIELLDPRFRYDVNGLTEEQIITLSSEIRPEDPTFWVTYLFVPSFKDRVLEIRVNSDGKRSYIYTLPTQSESPILKLNSILYRIRKASFNYNKLKVEVL